MPIEFLCLNFQCQYVQTSVGGGAHSEHPNFLRLNHPRDGGLLEFQIMFKVSEYFVDLPSSEFPFIILIGRRIKML